jgi:hypothetical protein
MGCKSLKSLAPMKKSELLGRILAKADVLVFQ